MKIVNSNGQTVFEINTMTGDVTTGAANLSQPGGPHTHPISDVTDLQTNLDGKASSSHSHAISDVTDLQTTLDGKAASSHSHSISDTTGLQTALDGKSDVGHTHAGGSDPWTMVVLEQAFSSSLTANTAVTGLSFTPAANKRYVVECYFLLRTATATVGPRPGFSFPTGLTDGGAWMEAPTTATAKVFRSWGPLNTQNAASTGVPTTTDSHLALGGALIICGATPSGNFQVTLASETAGTSVTMRAGSFIRYREI